MIIKVTNELKFDLLSYLYQDSVFNVLLLGHTLHYELNNNHEVYLQVESEEITACFQRYYTRGLFYSHTNQFNKKEMASFINSFQLNRIIGNQKTNLLSPYLEKDNVVNQFNYSTLDYLNEINQNMLVENAKKRDIKDIFELIKKTQFLKNDYIEINTKKINQRAGRLLFIKHNQEVIASCETSAETSDAALIGEVITDIKYRRQKIATKLVYQCCQDLLKEGKRPYLFYNDQNAGKVYHKLGFRDIGYITMIKFK